MNHEKHQPTLEEAKKVADMMTPEMWNLSEEREQELENREKESDVREAVNRGEKIESKHFSTRPPKGVGANLWEGPHNTSHLEYRVGGIALSGPNDPNYLLAETLIKERDEKIKTDRETMIEEFCKKHRVTFISSQKVGNVTEFGFKVAPANTIGWRVRERLADGIRLRGSASHGWSVWFNEEDLGKISNIFKPVNLPRIEEQEDEVASIGESDSESEKNPKIEQKTVIAPPGRPASREDLQSLLSKFKK